MRYQQTRSVEPVDILNRTGTLPAFLQGMVSTSLKEEDTMLVCYRCGKGIKCEHIQVNPSILALTLGDCQRSYHPKCYEQAEREAAAELKLLVF